MLRTRFSRSLLALLVAISGAQLGTRAAHAAEGAPEEMGKYVRIVRSEKKQPEALQTSIVRFVPRDDPESGVSVDLVGAVHVGDGDYYEELNEIFTDYDVVLYELVAPPGTRIRKGQQGSNHPVAMLQRVMKDVLELEHQLEQVDYTADNFVHADMSPSQFAKSMSDRGESFLQMYFRLLGAGLAMQSDPEGLPSDAELMMALFDKNRAVMLKRLMAEQFEKMGTLINVLDGPEGSTILSERNKAALKVLRKQLDRGEKKIAIFYGAAHLPDMAERLDKEFGLVPADTRWVTAWNLKTPSKSRSSGRRGN